MNEHTVTIGCPISNRKYLINRYLNGLLNIDYPKKRIKLYFLINNCTDSTDDELRIFKEKYKNEYLDIELEKYKMPYRKDMRHTKHRKEIYSRLSELRNHVLNTIQTDYFFSVDSDIIVKENVLKELLNANKDIIAATINNDKILRPYQQYPNIRTNLLINNYYGKNKDKIQIKHYMDFPLDSIVEVDYTGAVYLMKKEVCKTVKYGYHKQGEDIVFCLNAKEAGYKIFAHTGLWQEHIMCTYQNYCVANCCKNPCIHVDSRTKVYKYKYIDNVVTPDLIRCGKLSIGSKPLLDNYKIQ